MWILMVDDEKTLAETIKSGLEEEGYTVDICFDGEQAEILGITNDYDLAILDWRLPKKNGPKVLESWRGADKEFPVLMLSVLSDLNHKITGLDTGADDYMSKPFSFEELLARIRALGRRNKELSRLEKVEMGPLILDSRKRTVKVVTSELDLRPKEFALLELFVNNPETVITKTQLAERVWGSVNYVSDNTIEATVSTLRQKLDSAVCEHLEFDSETYASAIETKRGAGYRFNPNSLKTV